MHANGLCVKKTKLDMVVSNSSCLIFDFVLLISEVDAFMLMKT